MTVPTEGEQPLLSVLIATLVHREDRFLHMLGTLLDQAQRSSAAVEVLALQNNGSEPLADYRDRLLRAADGRYLCFADDDDTLSPNYVDRIAGALAEGPDCVGFRMTCVGTAAMVSELSTRHKNPPWDPVMHQGQLTYLREFNQAMPVLSSIAKQSTFKGGSHTFTGEDMWYVSRVVPLLRERGCREVFIPESLYCYRWDINDTTQAGPKSWSYKARYADHARPYVASKCFRWVE